MISHEHRCIFVHVPRTGGTSIEDVIWPGDRSEAQLWMGCVSRYHNKYQTGGLQHLLARQIRQEVGASVFDDYFKFAFVRNPWDKAVSQFSYMAQRPDLRELIGMAADVTFAEYLRAIQLHLHVQWERQVEFLRDENGECMVDFVGRFESIRQDARFIFEQIGVSCEELPRENPSCHRNYREYFDGETRERVRQLYAEDIEVFGYEFG
ncbi:MAG: sulfotransferase family 2 domain-containing protein [Terriglobia bacterium]